MFRQFGRAVAVASAAAQRRSRGVSAGVAHQSMATVGPQFTRGYAKVPDAMLSPLAQLTQTLENELAEDKRNYKGLREGDEGYAVPHGWTIVDKIGHRELIWKKKLDGGVTVTVMTDIIADVEPKFSDVGDENRDEDEERDPDFEDEEGEDDMGGEANMQFTVDVEREEGPNAGHITFDCKYPDYADEDDDTPRIGVQQVEFQPKERMEGAEGEGVNLQGYTGPNWDYLDPAVKDAFEKYLASIGVTGELGEHIYAMATDKESREYQNWINGVVGFFKKSSK